MTFLEQSRATGSPRRRGLRALAVITSSLLLSTVALAAAAPAQAVIGDPAVKSTAAGDTSVATTQGKADGSGLWGYAGDVKTRTSGNVFTYGIDVSPSDGSLWVTDSAKIVWTSNSFACALAGGTLVAAAGPCYVGDSKLNHYPVVGSDWSVGQYQTNGTYGTVAAGANAGVGANYSTLAAAQKLDGTTQPSGQFGGVRGVAVTNDGVAWAMDADAGYSWLGHANHSVRMTNPDGTEAGAIGKTTWASGTTWTNRNDPEAFDYPVGITRMPSGNMIVTSQTPELLKEYQSDGTFVRNIYLNQPAGTAYAGDGGYRSPYSIAADPTTGDLLVGYIDPGAGNATFIQRIDPTNCTTEAVGNPTGSSRDRCAVLNTIGIGTLAVGVGATTSNVATFAIEVEPRTGDIYVGQRSGLVSIFAADGTPRGKFSAFGNGTLNGQTATVRGIAFDANGFMYLTVSEGTTNTRVVIFARTPDPVTVPSAVYACAVDGNGDNTGAVDRSAVALSWTGVAGGVTADGQAPLRDYVVEQSTDSGATWSVVSTPTNTDTTQPLAGLNTASTYQFRVSAWNEAGNGDTAATTVADPTCDLPVADPGTITISKTVVDLGTAPAADTTYAFALSCTLEGAAIVLPTADATFVLAADEERTVTVAADAECVVSESTTGTFTTTYSDSDGSTDGTVSIVTAENSTVEVTNTYPEPIPGSLTVTKVVTGDNAPAATEFDFGLACTVEGAAVDLAGNAEFSLLAGGSRIVTDIPAGADCVVTEDAVENFTTTFADSDGSTDGTVAITADTASSVTVTNHYTAPPVECVADADAISVVYSTQNNANAPLDGSYTVYDRVNVGRTDMQLVYTIEKPCVTYPVPVLEYTGDWALDSSDANTYAQFDFEFGAINEQVAADYAAQLEAMNALLASSPDCVDRSISNFEACVRPIIEAWGASVPVGITGTVTASVRASTPGAGQLRFHLEQMETGEALSIEGITPYVVTQPTLTLSGTGAFCSATLEGYQDATHVYTPTHAVETPFALAATPAETGTYPDDATAIAVDTAGLTYSVDAQSFATADLVHEFLVNQPEGSYEVFAHYAAPDGVPAIDPAAVSIDVLGAADAACYTSTVIPVDPGTPTDPGTPSTPSVKPLASTGMNGNLLAVTIGGIVLLMISGGAFVVWGNRRRSSQEN